MSTNFYMVPKKHKNVEDKLYALQSKYNKKLKEFVEEYKNAVQKEVECLIKDENLKGIISYDDSMCFLDGMNLPYLWDYELPKLHIGKRSGGWKFIFQSNQYWKSLDDIKEFYNKNKNHLDIIDEYNKIYTLEQFIEDEVQPTYLSDKNISHIEYAKEHDYWSLDSYHIDKYGYEFDSRDFS